MTLWPVAIVAALLLASSSPSASWVPSSGGPKTPEPRPGRAAFDELMVRAGLPLPWRSFLALVAEGESKFDPSAINTSDAEAEAAGAAYDRLAAELAPCGFPREFWAWGSGGYFGQIPAIAAVMLEGCEDPGLVFDPARSTAAAVNFARRLMGYDGFQARPTWETLRRGWGCPRCMGDPVPVLKRAAWEADAAAVGLPSTFLDEAVPLLAADGETVLARLAGGP